MKLSKGFWQTYKETPAEAEIPSHKLMIRAGLIYKEAAGLYAYLPMGLRSIKKVEKIIREEHDLADCFEVAMTVVTPAEFWQESGRWDKMEGQMLKVEDRAGRELCISPTNEESIVDIFRKTISSYKQLPVCLYQINTKFRDEIRPRYGVMRSREFTMKDAYSFHLDKDCLDKWYKRMFQVYSNIWKRIGLEFIVVEADGGAMAFPGARTQEFQVLANSGEDKIMKCDKCGYAANIETAVSKRQLDFNTSKEIAKLVDTPDKKTMKEVCDFLKVKKHHALKSVVYSSICKDKEEFILAILLGDDELNEIKLKSYLKSDHVRAVTDKDFEDLQIPVGFIGPYKLPKDKLKVIYDEMIDLDSSYVTGGLEIDKHFINFIPNRDDSDIVSVDLREIEAGDSCKKCDTGKLIEIKGIEVGHIFQLGDKYTSAMKVSVLGKDGKAKTPIMGTYGIGTTRTVASAIEQNHDEDGIIWPVAIAPYHVHFIVISKNEDFLSMALEIYDELKQVGIEVVMDDRKVGPGFKFKDADLLGLPLRVTLGERDYNKDQLLEIRDRKSGEKRKVLREDLASEINKWLNIKQEQETKKAFIK